MIPWRRAFARCSSVGSRRYVPVRIPPSCAALPGGSAPALETDWSLAQLTGVLENGGSLHPDHMVAERLALLAPTHPLDAAHNLQLLINSDTRSWFAMGARESITTILTIALGAGGQAEVHARDTINRLVARGNTNFEELLPR